MRRLAAQLPLAIMLSAVALVAAVSLQALTLFRDQFLALRQPPFAGLRRLSLADSGRCALVISIEPQRFDWAQMRSVATVLGFDQQPPTRQRLDADHMPWMAVGAAQSPVGFLTTCSGALYAVDVRSSRASPPVLTPLGTLAERLPTVMECTGDGSLLVVSNGTGQSLSVWDRQMAKSLWQRTDLDVSSSAFENSTQRLFCGLRAGTIAELHPRTGSTLNQFDSPAGTAAALAISPTGRQLAALTGSGTLVVLDLDTTHAIWSRRLPPTAAMPRFSADGELLVAPCPRRGTRLVILSAQSGAMLGELPGAAGEVKGIEIGRNGIVLAIEHKGALTAWNLVTHTRLFRLDFPCLL